LQSISLKCTHLISHRASACLQSEYNSLRKTTFGYPLVAGIGIGAFETELLNKVIHDLKCGKASDFHGLTAEHMTRAHPILPVI